MGKFLTSPARTQQIAEKGMYKLIDNELYKDDDDSINYHWRNFCTDNFTWIKKGDWDIRCSHGHDIGCKHHEIIKLKLTESELWEKGYLKEHNGLVVCSDIPIKYLKVIRVSGHQINNLFYRMLRDADCPQTPKYIQHLYRCGVSLNFGWFLSGKIKIDLNRLYDEDWNKRKK